MPDSEWQDPIVEDVREARRQLFARFGNDIRALARHLRDQQAKSGNAVVSFPRRRLDEPESDAPHEGAA